MARAVRLALCLSLLSVGSASAASAASATQAAGALQFRFTPTARTQFALWIEKADGTFLQTVGLTQSVSFYGIGNRPGAAQMNSGFRWPYGRREGVLPIWAHRRATAPGAQTFRRVIFQDRASEGFASRTSNDSSPDPYFCLSFHQGDTPERRRQDTIDAVTCASPSRFMSDKGRFANEADMAASYAEPAVVDGQPVMRPLDLVSLYPPRRDVKPCAPNDIACSPDTADASRFDDHVRQVIPDIDAITMATPAPDIEHMVLFTIPGSWPDGDYVAWMEVNLEGDYNGDFNDKTYPTPTEPKDKWDSWAITSGYPYRGQPSVVFQVPFRIGQATAAEGVTAPSYFGDVDGFGTRGSDMHPIDGSITDDPAGAPGQGADRLRLIGASGHRLDLTVISRDSCSLHNTPEAPLEVHAQPVTDEKHSHQWGELSFVTPSTAAPTVQYQVRFSTDPIVLGDSKTFERALPAIAATAAPQSLTVPTSDPPGSRVSVKFGGMLPLTRYFVAIRAVDMCNVAGPYVVAELTTTKVNFTQLSGCFVATAAYGSALEPQVESLRRARDALGQGSPLFAAATDLYYRAGPAAAAVLARSDAARAVVRSVLAPVAEVAALVYSPGRGNRPSANRQ